MTKASEPELALTIRARIGRRLAIARVAKVGILPTALIGYSLARHFHWFAYVVVTLLFVEVMAMVMGEAQRCPRCDTSLVVRLGRRQHFANTCPGCGYLID